MKDQRGALLLLAALLLGALSGCGFHLRGWELDDSVQAVFVAAADGDSTSSTPLAAQLRLAFKQAGVELAERRSEADLLVSLLDQRRQRRSVSVTGQARAAEYEISRGARYSVRRSNADAEQVLIEPRWIEVERVVRVDRNNIVGNNEEQAIVERELSNDLIQQIIRSINQVLTVQNSTAAAEAG